MAITSSPSIKSESEMVPERRLVMPLEIFEAAMKGNRNVLIRHLGLQMKEQTEIQEDGDPNHKISQSTKDHPFGSELMPLTQRMSHFATIPNEDGDPNHKISQSTKDRPFSSELMLLTQRTSHFATIPNVTIEASYSASEQINTEHQTVQSELQSATRFGDTVLHLLVTNKKHNELSLKVFERDMSLLKARNKMLETPLYCAAKVGNNEVIKELIRINSAVVKDALNKKNQNGDTAMHVAVKNGCEDVSRELMTLDPEVAYNANNKMLTPLYMAIVKKDTNMEKDTNMVQTMLQVDRTLACTQFSDGMFPVHVVASVGNMSLVKHFFREYLDYAELLDTCGRNFFHFIAEQDHGDIIANVFEITSVEVIKRMYNVSDYEGNTPLSIAIMKGHKSMVRSIRFLEETLENIEDSTPVKEHSRRLQQLVKEKYVIDNRNKVKNIWEKIQVTGLGSVLITTVAFAASFTVPGGYNQDNGTPVLGRRYMFSAYILANAFAFIQGFISLFALLLNALITMPPEVIDYAVIFFLLAASSMVVAFGLGLYVTLAPVCLPIAILLLVVTLFLASPALLFVFITNKFIPMVVRILESKRTIVAGYMVPLVLIFSLALVSL